MQPVLNPSNPIVGSQTGRWASLFWGRDGKKGADKYSPLGTDCTTSVIFHTGSPRDFHASNSASKASRQIYQGRTNGPLSSPPSSALLSRAYVPRHMTDGQTHWLSPKSVLWLNLACWQIEKRERQVIWTTATAQ